MNEYDDRDIFEQGSHYTCHIEAMTREQLHDKSAIAAELAHRDIEIEKLKKEIAHVKANLTERNRILRARNDLPVDRLPYIIKVDELEAKCNTLEIELNLARQQVDKLQSQIDGDDDEH